MTKFIINSRTDAWKTDVNLLIFGIYTKFQGVEAVKITPKLKFNLLGIPMLLIF